ncbi:uncharacterized protein LOC117113698 [Anneissia japonica]|uniref:uncharacterized protein LOC117113698 n=1 Tax=Anneissia japonica TaxID=1529436 RepID=UPI00142572BB|nr:uncharacterized protein LOC117113698 [Anneissia japonica]
MEAESFLQSKSFSDVPKLSTEGQDNWLEYVEIQILHASVPTDLGVNSSLIVVPEKLISFEQRMKVLKKSQLWLKKPFWTVSSASFSVLFGIRRRKIVALLKQSGIKELDLKIQEEVHSMLALAIGIRSMSAHNIDDGVTSTMVETVQSWLHEKETANPGLASQLKLGGDWLDVASKMCK